MGEPSKTDFASPTLTDSFGTTRAALDKFSSDYMQAVDTYSFNQIRREQTAQHNDEVGLLTGRITLDQITRPVSIPLSILNAQEEQRKKAERTFEQLIIDQMMENMRQRLAELDERLAVHLKKLQAKYGEDVIGGMAATYLTEDELRGLKTDKDRMKALADMFLDDNGEVKDKYKDIEDAHYIRDLMKAEELRPQVEEYNRRNHLTVSEREQEYEASQSATLSENKSKLVTSTNDEYQETVDQGVDVTRHQQSTFKSSQGFSFS